MKQTGEQSEQGAVAAEAGLLIMLPLVTDEQARESQGDIERMLSIVIDGIDTHVAWDITGEEPLEVLKGILQRLEGQCRRGRLEERPDRGEHRLGRAHLDGVGHIKIAAPNASHFTVVRAAMCAVPRSNFDPRQSRPPLEGSTSDLPHSFEVCAVAGCAWPCNYMIRRRI